MKKFHIYIVEHFWSGEWHPTVGAALGFKDAKEVLQDWRSRNPDDKFRLKKYVALD